MGSKEVQVAEWTLETELCKLSGGRNLEDALHALGIVPISEPLTSVKAVKRWVRGGAETFIFPFSVFTQNSEYRLILKACTPTPSAKPIQEILNGWVRKREILTSYGVSTPALFAARDGVILEEFIDMSLLDAFKASNNRYVLMIKLCDTILVLRQLGYSTAALLYDLRSRGTDVVVVDFGSDLGERSVSLRHARASGASIENWLAGNEIPLSKRERKMLASALECEVYDPTVTAVTLQ